MDIIYLYEILNDTLDEIEYVKLEMDLINI